MNIAVNRAAVLDPLPDLLVRMAADDPTKVKMDKVWTNIVGLGNALFKDGVSPSFRPYISAEWLKVQSVVGDRVFFKSMVGYTVHPNGFMNGGKCYNQTITGGQAVRSAEKSIVTWHCRPITRFQAQDSNTIATGTAWRAYMTTKYKPGASIWHALATVAPNGNQSEWAYSPAHVIPASPAEIVPTTNVSAVRTLTDVVDTGIAPPTGITVTSEDGGSTILLNWNAVPADHGVIVRRVDYDPAISTLNDCCDLASGEGAGINPGDLFTVYKEFQPSVGKDDWNVVRNYNVQNVEANIFLKESDPVVGSVVSSYVSQETPKPALRVTLGVGAQGTIRRKCIGALDQSFYSRLTEGRTYQLHIRARLVSGTATFRAICGGLGLDQTLALTSTMTTFNIPFTRTADTDTRPTSPFEHLVEGGASGGVLEIEEIAAYETTGGKTYLGLSDLCAELFAGGAFAGVRDHDAAKTRPHGPDLHGLTDHNGTMFTNMKSMVGLVPGFWMQIPPWMPNDQYLGLMEWLRATYDPNVDTPASKPWAYKRWLTGQVAPWTDVFDIKIQQGNEGFNFASSSFWTIADGIGAASFGTAMALVEDRLARVMKSSPYWVNDGKMTFDHGGQKGQGFGADVLNATTEANFVHDNAYNGSDFYEAGPKASFTFSPGAVFALQQLDETRWKKVFGDKNVTRKARETALGRPIGLGVYEGQLSTPLAPGNGQTAQEIADQDYAWRSKGFQIPIVDNFVMSALNDYELWAFFIISGEGGNFWDGQSKVADGGATVASLQWLKLLSQLYLPGRIFRAKSTVERIDTVVEAGVTYPNVPQVFGRSFFSDAGKRGLLLRNRRIPGFGVDAAAGTGVTAATVVVPEGVNNVTIYTMSGDYTTSNNTTLKKDDLVISSTTVAAPVDRRLIRTVQPGDMQLLDFN